MKISLNPEQLSAIRAPDGPVLVLAGAGTGKTRVIVERIHWLVEERGIDPRNILALTFTNKAAAEMGARVADALDADRLAAWLGTFHKFGLFVLRREMEALGRARNFSICDDVDQLSLVKRLVKALPDSSPTPNPREVLHWISLHKQDVSKPELPENPDAEDKVQLQLWDQYHSALERSNALDFDDMLILLVRLFEEHPDIREKYQQRFRYVMVDEYQDTNRAQYRILRALCGEGANIFVVGDEDQAIYSWRGADVRNILDFESDFPGATTIRLEENYRSTQPILTLANALVAQNTQRLGKTLRTSRTAGDAPVFTLHEDASAETEAIAQALQGGKCPPGESAILFRTNGQARVVEEALLKRGIPYRAVGVVRFYTRREVKDLVAYLRLAVNPGDDEALRRVLNVPARGVGAATLAALEERAAVPGCSLYDELKRAREDAGGRLAKPAADFCAVVEEVSTNAREKTLLETLDALVERLDYEAYLRKQDEADFRTRQEVLDEFRNACGEFDAGGGRGVDTFLQEISLSSEMDQGPPEQPSVTLMTCHSAKGLEFDHVFLIGLEEGLLPHGASFDDEVKLEEERRLCYVAMTRARETLHLSAARSRTLHGETKSRRVSRFIEALPETLLLRDAGEAAGFRAEGAASRVDADKLKTGTRVRHAKFGNGTVMYKSGTGPAVKVRIRFDRGGARQFLVRAAPLEIVQGARR